jgi:glutamine synthetase
VPAGPPETRHVEHRVAGADAIPIWPRPPCWPARIAASPASSIPVPPSRATATSRCPRALPSNWYDALARTEGSAFLKEYLGARFMEIYCAIKRAEQDRFYSQVTELDFEWYLRTA